MYRPGRPPQLTLPRPRGGVALNRIEPIMSAICSPRVLPVSLRLGACALACALTGGAALANQSFVSSGAGLTLGPVYNRNNIGSAGFNPAGGLRLVGPHEQWRVGLLDGGMRYEIGTVDDLKHVTDQVRADIDAVKTDISLDALANANAALARLNGTYLPQLEAGTRLSLQGRASLLAPVLMRSQTLRGVLALAADVQVQGAGQFRRSDAVLTQPTPTHLNYSLTTASAFDVKLARVTHISLGYSTDVSHWLPEVVRKLGDGGQLDLGVRLNSYRARLERQTVALVDASGSSTSFDLGSRANRTQAKATALDLGIMWGDAHCQLGATVYNIGSPRLRYPDPLPDGNAANRAAAATLIAEGRISALDAVSLKPHAVLEASVFSSNRRWLLQTSLATNATPDFVGELQRYATLAVAYNAERYEGDYGALLEYIVPSIRLGVRRNMAGSRLASTALGLSWGVFSIDLSASQKSVNVDGSKAPRAAGVAVAVEEKF
jgi:hypothetical protein